MDLRVLASRSVLLTNLASIASGYSAIGVSILLPFLLVDAAGGTAISAFGLSAGPLLTGVVLLPRALGQTAGGPLTIPLTRLIGPARTFAIGMLLLAGGALGLAAWRSQMWMLLVELAALGLGFGVAVSMSGSVVTLTADPAETSVAASINSVLRRVGGAVGAQVAVALLAAFTLSGGAPAPRAFTIAFTAAAAVAAAGGVGTVFIRVRLSPHDSPPMNIAESGD